MNNETNNNKIEKREKKQCRLKYFPVSAFSILFGFAGLTIITQKLEEVWKMDLGISKWLLLISMIIFVIFGTSYLYKMIFHWDEIKKEFSHPVKLSFFPALSVSFLLLSIAMLKNYENIAEYFLIIGSILQLFFTIKIIGIWINHDKFKLNHLNPAWFIPILGNVLVPISATHFGYTEISWFFFSIGFWFWIIVMVLFFNRIIFHGQMADRFIPTLFILISPPFIAFIAYTKLTGKVDIFGKNLYFLGLFLFMILVSQWKVFSKVKFYLSSWAYTFPIASLSIATVLMYHGTKLIFYKYLSLIFAAILVLIIFLLFIRTIKAIKNRELCLYEEH